MAPSARPGLRLPRNTHAHLALTRSVVPRVNNDRLAERAASLAECPPRYEIALRLCHAFSQPVTRPRDLLILIGVHQSAALLLLVPLFLSLSLASPSLFISRVAKRPRSTSRPIDRRAARFKKRPTSRNNRAFWIREHLRRRREPDVRLHTSTMYIHDVRRSGQRGVRSRPIDLLSSPMRGLIARSPRRGEAELLVADDGRNLPGDSPWKATE